VRSPLRDLPASAVAEIADALADARIPAVAARR
jgi:hypothetical protein